MKILVTVMMYLLWVATIIAVLITTFTNFQYEDLNALSIALLVFSLVNTFFVVSKK